MTNHHDKTLQQKIDQLIRINFNKLNEVKEQIRINRKLYGSPSVYWNQSELYTKKECLEGFIEELSELNDYIEKEELK
jgi:hypothetical protein